MLAIFHYHDMDIIEQELGAIYLLEMTKCLTSIFGKGLPWDIKNRTSYSGAVVGWEFINPFLAIGHFAFVSKITGEGKLKTLYIR